MEAITFRFMNTTSQQLPYHWDYSMDTNWHKQLWKLQTLRKIKHFMWNLPCIILTEEKLPVLFSVPWQLPSVVFQKKPLSTPNMVRFSFEPKDRGKQRITTLDSWFLQSINIAQEIRGLVPLISFICWFPTQLSHTALGGAQEFTKAASEHQLEQLITDSVRGWCWCCCSGRVCLGNCCAYLYGLWEWCWCSGSLFFLLLNVPLGPILPSYFS